MDLPLRLLFLLAALAPAEFLRSSGGPVAHRMQPRSDVAGRPAPHGRETRASGSGSPAVLQTSQIFPVQGPLEVVAERVANATYGAEARVAAASLEKTRDARGSEGVGRVLPTNCPVGMPANDPFWAQESTGYRLDSHRDVGQCRPTPCTKNPTNGQRLATLRRLANATDVLMRTHDIDYTITSGTLLGAHRCADVVPWDGDVDVQILASDRHKLDALFEPSHERRRSLDFIGFPTFVLLQLMYTNCFPWRLVDTSTGYYSDIFSPVIENGVSTRPIYPGKLACNPSWLYRNIHAAPRACEWKTCDSTPVDAIWPSRRCRFADFYVNCPANSSVYLEHMFTGNVDKPDVPIRSTL